MGCCKMRIPKSLLHSVLFLVLFVFSPPLSVFPWVAMKKFLLMPIRMFFSFILSFHDFPVWGLSHILALLTCSHCVALYQ